MNDSGRKDAASVLASMLRRVLRPLVRLLVAQQVQYPFVASIVKSLYIDVASSDFALDGKRVTVSRLSLLTGIHRREVKRLQAEGMPGEASTPDAITLGAQIVARWTGEAAYRDEEGRPLALPRQTEDEAAPSFHGLVKSVSVDIHPRSVLDEWLRIGVASLDEEGRVVLGADAFVPARGFEEKAHFVGRNVRDHLAAAARNLASDVSPHLERSVYYGALPPEAVRELESLAREAGQAALERVNERARVLKERAEGRADSERVHDRRFTFGVYQFDVASDADGRDAEDDAEDDMQEDDEDGTDERAEGGAGDDAIVDAQVGAEERFDEN